MGIDSGFGLRARGITLSDSHLAVMQIIEGARLDGNEAIVFAIWKEQRKRRGDALSVHQAFRILQLRTAGVSHQIPLSTIQSKSG